MGVLTNKQTNKIDMKNKLIAVLATFGMVASASAVKVNNNLSINGFIDGSYTLRKRWCRKHFNISRT